METTLNNKKFAQRLQKVMDDHQLSATALAEKLEIGRATISHLMSGRNKPSLDFIMKVVSVFETVELQWLIYGTSTSQKEASPTPISGSKFHESETKNTHVSHAKKPTDIFGKMSASPSKIKRVILLLEDGTFENYEV